jgi:metallo-beta-lactamase family protein
VLIKNGFAGRIFCTHSTADLARILLPDAGHLQEKDADFANRHGFSKHKPALPLYTLKDAEDSLERLAPLDFEKPLALPGGASAIFRRAGHIIGASTIELRTREATVVFSGDLGRYGDPVMVDPQPVRRADCLLVESTYGNRRHDRRDPKEALFEIISTTVGRGGTVIIPAFAVGRAQSLMFYLERIKASGRLNNVPVFLDSPMAVDATEVFSRRVDDQRLTREEWRRACGVATYTSSVEESKALTANTMPKVIISASGMATGGRILHHLKRYGPDPKNTILFAGFQAAGTRGADMIAGVEAVKIHGEYVPVRAEVKNLDMLSAHADADEILRWLRGFERPPRITYLIHGEPAASDTLRRRIEEELRWRCAVAEHGERVELS